jgi:hypothetical protein
LINRRSAPRALAAVAAAVLIGAGVAGADSPGSFSDPVGDARSGMDITGLQVSERSDGDLSFEVTVADPANWDEDGPLVALDLDQNPDTGSAFYGTEVELAFAGEGNAREGEPVLLRARGWDFKSVPPPEGWGWELGPNLVGFFINRSQLGLAPDAGFNVVAAVIGQGADTAPDIRTFNYQPNPASLPPPLQPDRRPPHLTAYPAAGVHGRIVPLSYWALDGRGKTAEVIRIYRRNRLVATLHRPLGDSNPFRLTKVGWRVPRDVHGRLRYSVRSFDAAGNRSKVSWAPLRIR